MSHSLPADSDDLLNRAIELHYADLKSAMRKRGHSPGAASDIVHDLYIKLSERPDALHGKRSLRAFLIRAAANLGIDRLRRSSFEERLFSGSEEEALAVPTVTAAPDEGLLIQARLTLLRSAIAELPLRRRAVFILHRLHQLSPDAIGRKLGISRNSVDRHLREALAHCLDRLLGSD